MKLRKVYVLIGFVIVIGLVACSGDEAEAPRLTFAASPEVINEGESSTLTWDVRGSEPMTLTLEPVLPDDVALTSPLDVSPIETTTYTLTATNSAGSQSREVTVTVNQRPQVMSFELSSESIVQGRSLTVSWETSSDDPVTATLTPSDTPDEPVTSPLTLSPTETTTYTLTLTNSAGSTSREFTVAVTPPAAPTITSLTSTPTAGNGLEVTLNWQLSSASACSIELGDSSPALSFEDCVTTTEVRHTYSEAGTYIVTFSLSSGATQTLRLTVSPTDNPTNTPPTVNAGDDVSVTLGDYVTLTGQATDPDGNTLILAWELTDKPFTSTFEFSLGGTTDTLTTTFRLDVPGVYSFRLTARDGNSVVSDDTSITVVDDSPRNSVYFVPDDVATNLVEGQPQVVELERTGSTTSSLTVSLRVAASSSATADDYNITDATLADGIYQVRFEERRSRTRLVLTATEDTLDEGTETVVIALLAGDDYEVMEPSQVTLNIVDDAPEPGEPEPPILRSCQGGIIVRYQEDIDALFACRTVLGTLIIDPDATLPFNDVPTGSPITSLVPLRYLETVTEAFRIKNIPTLNSLEGLERLSSTRDIFELTNLDGLTSLKGLDNLVTVGSFLIIESNDNLVNLDGLQRLEKTDGQLIVRSNLSLTALTGLENLSSTGFFGLAIEDNPQLVSLAALAKLESVGGRLSIRSNSRLESLAGLENLSSVGGLHIVSNEQLSSLTSINKLEFVGFSGIHILDNPRLTSLGTFEQLTSVEGDVLLAANDSLSSLKSFENITRIAGVLGIGDASSYYGDFGTGGSSDNGSGDSDSADNDSGDSDTDMRGTQFSSLTELTSLTSVGGLHISDNPHLSSLAGLEKLTALSTSLRISNNAVLASLAPLANINSPVQSLVIDNNDALTTLTGLEGITGISEDFDESLIQHNDALVSLAAIANLTDDDIAGYIAVSDNTSLDCPAQNLQFTLDASLGNLLDCVSIEGSQPTINTFTIAPETLTAGQTATLSWDVTGAAPITVSILPDIGEVELSGSLQVTPTQTTSYRLTASNAVDSFTARVIVTVLDGESKVCGDVFLVSTQAKLDELAGCTEIGNLFIQETEPGAITSLQALSELSYVSGALEIGMPFQGNNALSSLAGLEKLAVVDSTLVIGGNAALTSLENLANLREVGGALIIRQNPQLNSLAGLANLSTVGLNFPEPPNFVDDPNNYFQIIDNDALSSLSGLDKLERVEAGLLIADNDGLSSLAGMPALEQPGGLTLSRNPQLTSLTGLENITDIGSLSIFANPQLTSLAGLDGISSGDRLGIISNDVLSSLDGLEDIPWNAVQITDNPVLSSVELTNLATSITSVFIERNTMLSTITLNSTAPSSTGTLWITENPALTSFVFPSLASTFEMALSNVPLTSLDLTGLNTIEHNFFVSRTSLVTLAGLNNLETIQGEADISFNTELTSLTGLENLNSAGLSLQIGLNPVLTSLAGLDNLQTVEGPFSLNGNPQLTSLAALANLSSTGRLSIDDNDALGSLAGLENLSSVDDLSIGTFNGNDALTSIAALSNLTTVENNISISNNPLLTSLSGLENITNYSDGNTVQIVDNASLDCTPPPVLPFSVDTSTGNLVNCPTN
ncbi:MAG: hypothetical protein AAF708_07265 [Deinococcota bacterium]